MPFPAGATDLLSDVSNGKIAFSRVAASGQVLIVVYDIGTGTTTEIDPQPASIRFGAAIGADTVAFFDQTVTAEGELFASDLGAGGLTGQQVTNDSRIDHYPSVSPLGDDAVSNAYKYVWKTEKAWAGTCRQLVLKFADGSTQRASFKFK